MPTIAKRYELGKEIGVGGMSTIYAAKDLFSRRMVAIKIMDRSFAYRTSVRKRFVKEAEHLAKMNHPNILTILDGCEQHSSTMWMATEYVNGSNLDEFLSQRGGKIHPLAASLLILELLKPVSYIHGLGIVHRDLKLSNIMLTRSGRLKLLDFGISKDMADDETAVRVRMGSPSYMSPEQIRCGSIDHRTDIYSIGVIFYRMLTGRFPFSDDNPEGLLEKIHDQQYPSIRARAADLPQGLEEIIRKCLESTADDRYQQVYSIKNDLNRILARYGLQNSSSALSQMFQNENRFQAFLVEKSRSVLAKRDLLNPLQNSSTDKPRKIYSSSDILLSIPATLKMSYIGNRSMSGWGRAIRLLIVGIFIGGSTSFYFVKPQKRNLTPTQVLVKKKLSHLRSKFVKVLSPTKTLGARKVPAGIRSKK